jgi:hypothetical protein
MPLRAKHGNSMTEYALPIVTILLVGIGGATLLQEALQNNLMQTYQDSGTVGQNGAMTLQRMGQPSYLERIGIRLPDGTMTYIDDVPRNLGQSVETIGASGTTELLAAALHSLGMQLKEADEISNQEAQLIVQLAQQGHKIAELQRLVEQAMKASNGNLEQLGNMRIPFDGQLYSTMELAYLIGGAAQATENPDFGSFFKQYQDTALQGEQDLYAGTVRHDFLQLLQQVQGSPLFENEAVGNLVNQLSTDINELAEVFAENTHYTFLGEYSANEFEKKVASQLTGTKSGQICQSTGQHTDTGSVCQQ